MGWVMVRDEVREMIKHRLYNLVDQGKDFGFYSEGDKKIWAKYGSDIKYPLTFMLMLR